MLPMPPQPMSPTRIRLFAPGWFAGFATPACAAPAKAMPERMSSLRFICSPSPSGRSEYVFRSELHDASGSGCQDAAGQRAGDCIDRLAEVRSIGHVEELGAELDAGSLGNCKVLEKRSIPRKRARPVDEVPSRGSNRARRRNLKGLWIVVLCDQLISGARRIEPGSSYDVGPVISDAIQIDVRSGEHIEGNAALQMKQSVQLP